MKHCSLNLDEHNKNFPLFEICGSYTKTIDLLTHFSRVLWDYTIQTDQLTWINEIFDNGNKIKTKAPFRLIKNGTLCSIFNENILFLDFIKRTLKNSKLIWDYIDENIIKFDMALMNPFELPNRLSCGIRSEANRKYHVMRAIRKHYELPISPNSRKVFHIISDELNKIIAIDLKRRNQDIDFSCIEICKEAMIRSLCINIHHDDDVLSSQLKSLIDCFFEVARLVGYLRPSYRLNKIKVITKRFDAEYLYSNLFGLPTSICGFDSLFGGGGIILPERKIKKENDPLEIYRNQLRGKAIVITGESGTGKSIISHRIATEVASKGGVSWIMPIEQSVEECLYTLESFNALDRNQVSVATNFVSGFNYLKEWKEDENKGVLLVLKDDGISSYYEFIDTVINSAESIEKGNKRIIVIDPLNSIAGGADNKLNYNYMSFRSKMMDMIRRLKKSGINIIIVVEEGQVEEESSGKNLGVNYYSFAENVADIIIRLSVQKNDNYAQRYIEIKKSRMQREQRGEHPFSISAGEGAHVFPSTASIATKIRDLRPPYMSIKTKFGLDGIDYILNGSFFEGDVIAFTGPAGSFKTLLGILFLLVTRKQSKVYDKKQVSLIFTSRDNEISISHLLSDPFVREHSKYFKNKNKKFTILDSFENLIVCPMPKSHLNPGKIFQYIEIEIQKARSKGCRVHRILFDSLSQLTTSSPQIKNDPAFATTLVDFIKTFGISSLIVCGENTSLKDNDINNVITDNADCIFQFDRIEFRGLRRVVFRIIKSRSMTHRLETFELNRTRKSIDIRLSSSLLRLSRERGRGHTANIKLFFYPHTKIQKNYYNAIGNAIKTVFSDKTEISFPDRLYVYRAMKAWHHSAIDELQIFQMSEADIYGYHGNPEKMKISLHDFPIDHWKTEQWGPIDNGNRFRRAIFKSKNKKLTFHAVPFYQNISFLAYRLDEFSKCIPDSWNMIYNNCIEWEKENKIKAKGCYENNSQSCNNYEIPIFFDFPKHSAENYNCLFFEILLSLTKPKGNNNQCPLKSWLYQDCVIDALVIYRQLCKRAHEYKKINENREKEQSTYSITPFKVSRKAKVWRHWYSTYNQMMSEMGIDDDPNQIKIAPLPNQACITSNWYLGLPAYSTAPDVGLEIIKLLTSRESDIERLHIGAGLPLKTRLKYKEKHFLCSTYTEQNIYAFDKLIENAFNRSVFNCYYQISNILSYYLKKVIEIENPEKVGAIESNDLIRVRIKDVFDEFFCAIDYVQGKELNNRGNYKNKNNYTCNRCKQLFKNKKDFMETELVANQPASRNWVR